MGEGLRTLAARLRIRVLERLKHLGFNLLGYGTSWPTSFNLSRQLQRPMRLKKTPQQSSSEKLTETRMIRARTGLLFLLADSRKAGAGCQPALGLPRSPPGESHDAEPRQQLLPTASDLRQIA